KPLGRRPLLVVWRGLLIADRDRDLVFVIARRCARSLDLLAALGGRFGLRCLGAVLRLAFDLVTVTDGFEFLCHLALFSPIGPAATQLGAMIVLVDPCCNFDSSTRWRDRTDSRRA